MSTVGPSSITAKDKMFLISDNAIGRILFSQFFCWDAYYNINYTFIKYVEPDSKNKMLR